MALLYGREAKAVLNWLKVPCVLSGRRGWFRVKFKKTMNVQN